MLTDASQLSRDKAYATMSDRNDYAALCLDVRSGTCVTRDDWFSTGKLRLSDETRTTIVASKLHGERVVSVARTGRYVSWTIYRGGCAGDSRTDAERSYQALQ